MWWFWLSVVMNVVPTMVGLAFVLRHPGRGRWRTWGLLGFGSALAAGLGQVFINALFISAPDTSGAWFQAFVGPLSMAFQLLTLLGWGFVIAAVLDDRRDVPVRDVPVRDVAEADTAVCQPLANDVGVDDPLGYDPADFEPPRITS